MHLFQRTALFFALSVQFLPNVVSAAVAGPLKAGAARVEITPDANAIPRPFTSILDSLYARAIYLENGHDRAALLNADVGAISTAVLGHERCGGAADGYVVRERRHGKIARQAPVGRGQQRRELPGQEVERGP